MTESPLGWLALARGTLDRMSARRRDDDWIASLWSDPRTRVVAVEGGKVLVSHEPTPRLVFLPPDRAPEGERYLLGLDEDGIAYFAVSGPLPAVEAAEPAGLRRVGALLGDRDSGLMTHAVAMQNWHATHTHCPRCGTPTELTSVGHTRTCPADGSDHFPRVDPAVIMLVYDSDDRILLARGPNWPGDRRSILAGFVEPGESLEQAVAREVHEEVGLTIEDIRYLGSQPWPLPQSLMVGFFAHAHDGQTLRPDAEEIEDAAWYTRDELRVAIETKKVVPPGRLSIASRLISRWYGSELPAAEPF